MADEGTASTLVLVGAILQLLLMIGFLALGGLLLIAWLIWPDPMFLFIIIFYFAGGVVGLILMILWFMWRSAPSAHKTGLIITGILGLILSGVLPGLLVLIGGIIAPSEA